MGKIIKTKAHRGTHRSAGAFHSSEVLAACSMAMELEDIATSKNEPAKQPRREEASVAATASGVVAEEEVGGGSVHAMPIGHMSRGQRKRFARKASVKNKMLLAGKLRGKEIKLKEGALGEMGALELSLPSPPATKAGANRQGSMKMTKRNRRRLMVAETAQLAAVLAHPSFQANPLGTIHDHLENSIRLANASSQ